MKIEPLWSINIDIILGTVRHDWNIRTWMTSDKNTYTIQTRKEIGVENKYVYEYMMTSNEIDGIYLKHQD